MSSIREASEKETARVASMPDDSTYARHVHRMGYHRNVDLDVVLSMLSAAGVYGAADEISLVHWRGHPEVQDQIRHLRHTLKQTSEAMLKVWSEAAP